MLAMLLLALLPFSLAAQSPQRVLSLDFCADQYLLKFLPRERIAGLSPDAVQDFSYLRERAYGLPQVRPQAEDVLLRQPDLVLRSYGGGPRIAQFLERAGIRLLQLPWISTLDELLAAIESTASALGARDQGLALTSQLRRRLAAIKPPAGPRPQALYLTPGGVTTGPGSLIHQLMQHAGLDNYQQRSGWHALPLERLVYQQPDLIVSAFFSGDIQHLHGWSAMRHPVARNSLRQQPVVELNKASLACGIWSVIDAVEAMAAARQQLQPSAETVR